MPWKCECGVINRDENRICRWCSRHDPTPQITAPPQPYPYYQIPYPPQAYPPQPYPPQPYPPPYQSYPPHQSAPQPAYYQPPPQNITVQVGHAFDPPPQQSGIGLVIAGYLCALASLAFVPLGFGLAGVVIGCVNISRNRVGNGIMQIVLSVFCASIGMIFGLLLFSTIFAGR